MNETKNTEVQTINLNFGVTAEVVDLARTYLDKGAVDKEVIMRGLDVFETAVSIIATAATKPRAQEARVGSRSGKYTSDKVKKWWEEDEDEDEDEEVKKDNSCKKAEKGKK